MIPFWTDEIEPVLKQGSRVLMVAHNEVLKRIIRILGNRTEQEVADLRLPFGRPFVLELDQNNQFKMVSNYFVDSHSDSVFNYLKPVDPKKLIEDYWEKEFEEAYNSEYGPDADYYDDEDDEEDEYEVDFTPDPDFGKDK